MKDIVEDIKEALRNYQVLTRQGREYQWGQAPELVKRAVEDRRI